MCLQEFLDSLKSNAPHETHKRLVLSIEVHRMKEPNPTFPTAIQKYKEAKLHNCHITSQWQGS